MLNMKLRSEARIDRTRNALTASPTSPVEATPLRSFRLLLIGLVAYVAAYSLPYLNSPAGRFPLLDGAENLDLAHRIAAGTLPIEPFFRAMLYPGFLALGFLAGFSTEWMPVYAGLAGGLMHIGSVLCVYSLARRVWNSRKAALIASLLFGFNPLAVYFSAEPLDTTLGLLLFLAGLNLLHAAFCGSDNIPGEEKRILKQVIAGTALWVLAMLTRPHYAIVLMGLPLLLIVAFGRRRKVLVWAIAGFAGTTVVGLGTAGLLQKRINGEFRVMPTQGAYSLWVGNRPGANGRYYVQQLHFTASDSGSVENPARVESELLYQRETGKTGPVDVNQMNHYWRQKTIASIQGDFAGWLGLMLRKVYYLMNNFEQYNNKTFAVQKSLSPLLRFNPLCWGVTLTLCAIGLVLAWKHRRAAGSTMLIFTAVFYAVGVVAFFVSDRFRLPLLPFVCIGAGAVGCISPASFRGNFRTNTIKPVIIGLITLVVTFSRGWGAYDLSQAVQDYVGLSLAAGKAGNDLEALRWAELALRERPKHPDALICAVTSFYNARLRGIQCDASETWQLQLDRIEKIEDVPPKVFLVEAVALWKVGKSREAGEVLHSIIQARQTNTNHVGPSVTEDDSLGVLLLTQLAGSQDELLARGRARETASFYLLAGLRRRETPTLRLIPDSRRNEVDQIEPFVRNLFPDENRVLK